MKQELYDFESDSDDRIEKPKTTLKLSEIQR